ncbi:diaminopimelate epimerase [Desulfosoma caldarium]|uniref:Diaminopimelate epimerase n=1 Tax=Desulfosoma caldarium TaxID=610254 RepID=A0A3N1USA4_9BACT|nr:diaminopimelate epimerase [Desulfosoma caldarium]ROQ92259.1 diaminopimelate epimerase [Desulfosoma caldarium]
MERIPFLKMTGSGNDFILIDNRTGLVPLEGCKDFVKAVCRRKLSAGADGVILIENDAECDFAWRFYNADGSEAEMCGNGARCAARFAHLRGIVSRPSMIFRTLAGKIQAHVDGLRVRVQMTPPHGYRPNLNVVIEDQTLRVHAINTGVPHVVLFADSPKTLSQWDVFAVGRSLRYHSLFAPAGTNVNFVAVLGPSQLKIRTYERGVEDETLACGTGSIAAALIAAAQGLVQPPVHVETQSGETLVIHFHQTEEAFDEVFLEGDARVVYEGLLWSETLGSVREKQDR